MSKRSLVTSNSEEPNPKRARSESKTKGRPATKVKIPKKKPTYIVDLTKARLATKVKSTQVVDLTRGKNFTQNELSILRQTEKLIEPGFTQRELLILRRVEYEISKGIIRPAREQFLCFDTLKCVAWQTTDFVFFYSTGRNLLATCKELYRHYNEFIKYARAKIMQIVQTHDNHLLPIMDSIRDMVLQNVTSAMKAGVTLDSTTLQQFEAGLTNGPEVTYHRSQRDLASKILQLYSEGMVTIFGNSKVREAFGTICDALAFGKVFHRQRAENRKKSSFSIFPADKFK
jgi:hypothetical protein